MWKLGPDLKPRDYSVFIYLFKILYIFSFLSNIEHAITTPILHRRKPRLKKEKVFVQGYITN